MIASRVLKQGVFKLGGKFNANLWPESLYEIKKGYHHALVTEAYDDRAAMDEWQRKVYELANELILSNHYKTVIDVGCGSAHKLVNMKGGFSTTGIEIEPTYSWLKNQYPERNWINYNSCDPSSLSADLVICADVIEHFENPDELMEFLQKIHFRKLLISTPERDKVAGRNSFGPPVNPSHFREWNAEEFNRYLSHWFSVEESFVLEDKSCAQVKICKNHML